MGRKLRKSLAAVIRSLPPRSGDAVVSVMTLARRSHVSIVQETDMTEGQQLTGRRQRSEENQDVARSVSTSR
jgi:hypothetical protein